MGKIAFGWLLGLFIVSAFPLLSEAQLLDQTEEWVLGSHIDGTYTIDGSGDDAVYTITGNGLVGDRVEPFYNAFGDEGFFVYTQRTGSVSLQAKLFPYAGQSALMCRQVSDVTASNFYSVELVFDEGEGIIGASALFRTREGAGGNVSIPLYDEDGNRIEDTGDGLWFRVTRVEPVDVFFSEYSPDGENWFIADSRVIKWPEESALFGIAVGSNGNNSEVGEVEVSNLSFVSTPPVAQRKLSHQSFKASEVINVELTAFVSGEDRNTVTIEETVPQGWSISNISDGGSESNGVISWSLTGLPVGDTTVSYTVTAPSAPDDFADWTGRVFESVDILGPNTIPFLDITGGERTDDGLLVLYTFNEGDGLTVFDSSGVGEPMNLAIEDPNNAEWGDGFLETTGVNQIATEGPATKMILGCKETDELTVEGWIKTSDITQNGPARIITCSIDSVDRNFTFGQGRYNAGGDRIEMRYRTDVNPGAPRQVTEVNTARGTLTEALTHVVLVRDSSGGAYAYINNESLQLLLSGSTPVTEVEGGFSTWDESYKFGVGNEISAQRAWLGEFHLVAVYNKALSADEVSQNYNAGPFVGDDSAVSNWAIYLD